MSTKHEELASRAERGELAVKPGTVRRGDAAAHDEIQRLVMEATGASTVQEATKLAVGRPRLGAKAGQSPVVRARVPQSLKERVAALAEREQRAESDIVREALAAYVEMRQVS
jgi:hypothetical protein